jgi:hypothetical protein
MSIFRNIFTIYHETPDPTAVAGGGGAGNPAAGTPPAGQGQPPAGAAQPQGVRQFFPDVPDEHWAIMEPHVGRFEGTVTQLQQQVAGFKPLVDAGYTPERLQGLIGFENKFAQAPLDTWLELGQMLQKGENGQRPAIDPDVDLEYLAAIARGEDPDATPGVPQGQPGAPQPGQLTPELQAAYEMINALKQEVSQLQGTFQQDQVQRQTQVQDRFYETRIGQMKDVLKKSGWPEELLTDEMLGGQVIVHKGRFDLAAKALIDQRAALLKGISDPRLNPNDPNNPRQTALPNGVPPTAPRNTPRARDSNDPFKTGTRNAEARLKRLNGGS